ncbi:MAG: glycosyltransferase family 2 protein [Chloroflexia bacterium]|nr:glycosyltransferase family 2 protein [Chloroflexia bacterium]
MDRRPGRHRRVFLRGGSTAARPQHRQEGHRGTRLVSDIPDSRPTATVVIPCLNEGDAIGGLVAEVLAVAADPNLPVRVDRVLVVDNGSTDHTAASAAAAGAGIVSEPRRGYGRACLSGVLAARDADIIVLMDGDRSDQPAELPRLLEPLLAGEADLVIGSRIMGDYEPGSLLPQQIFGNRVATFFLRLVFRVRMTDIGPFRVIRREQLLDLGMREMTYGWSIEMIARAAKSGLRVREVPVSYRKRAAGESKVSGNLRASVKAGYRIMFAIVRAKRDSLPLPEELAEDQRP